MLCVIIFLDQLEYRMLVSIVLSQFVSVLSFFSVRIRSQIFKFWHNLLARNIIWGDYELFRHKYSVFRRPTKNGRRVQSLGDTTEFFRTRKSAADVNLAVAAAEPLQMLSTVIKRRTRMVKQIHNTLSPSGLVKCGRLINYLRILGLTKH